MTALGHLRPVPTMGGNVRFPRGGHSGKGKRTSAADRLDYLQKQTTSAETILAIHRQNVGEI